jgi:hypothetical protein
MIRQQLDALKVRAVRELMPIRRFAAQVKG